MKSRASDRAVREPAPASLAGRVALVALAYFVTGRLGLLLAAPPGYATAVWPPSGIALAAVLLLGRGAALGVWIGSLAVNFTAFAGGDAPFLPPLLIAAAIATGSSLQALFGARLVRRFVGFPTALDRERDIVRFLALAGPGACVVAATIAVLALRAADVVAPDEVTFSWWTWWAGDSMGVVVIAPLVLTAFAEPKAAWRPRRTAVAIPLLAICALAIALFLVASDAERDRLDRDLTRRGELLQHSLQQRLDDVATALDLVVALYDSAGGDVDAQRFETFSQDVRRRTPDIVALEWAPAAGGNRFPVEFVSPERLGPALIGFDVGGDPARRRAIDESLVNGGTATAAPLAAAPEPGAERGAVALAPVHRSSDGSLRGFVLVVFRPAEIAGRAVADGDAAGLGVELRDPAVQGAALYLHRPDGSETDPAGEPGAWTAALTVEVPGRRWALAVAAGRTYMQSNRSILPWIVLFSGVLFGGLLCAFLLSVSGRASAIEQQISERTAALRASEDKLKASLREKEALLKEIHHRVKNNLQIIDSLLHLQAGQFADPGVRHALVESKNRLRTMALIHESLYRSDDVAHVDIAAHVENLCAYLYRAFGVDPGRIRLALAVDPIALDLDLAIPVGLLVNELVSNAIKHAFPESRAGTLRVELRQLASGELCLEVADDGVGLPTGHEEGTANSLGMQLVGTLVRQIRGRLELARSPGTSMRIVFRREPAAETPA